MEYGAVAMVQKDLIELTSELRTDLGGICKEIGDLRTDLLKQLDELCAEVRVVRKELREYLRNRSHGK